jgi:Fur family transcriptional regulator, zinc uptake regulator
MANVPTHVHDSDALMAAAERAVSARGETLTAPRAKVLGALLSSGRPMKAYDLMAVAGGEDGPAKPPTVYRALDFLCRMGLVHRIESDATFVACGHLHDAPDGLDGASGGHDAVALLVCERCGHAEEVFVPAAIAAVGEAAAAAGFAPSRLVLEGRGQCAACAAG